MNLDDQLREALKRQDPPAGFAERVIRQAGSAPQPSQIRKPGWRQRMRWLWYSGLVAAAASILFAMTVENRHRQEEEAGRQVILALRIASEQLNLARDKALNK